MDRARRTDAANVHLAADDADSFTKEAMLADASNPAFSKFAAITQLPSKGRGTGALPAHHATATSSVNQPIAPPAPLGGGLQRAVTMPASSGRPVAAISVGSHAGGGAESPTASAGSSAGVGTSWAAVFAAPGTPALSPPQRPPGEPSSDQEWPSLGGGSGGSATALSEVSRPTAQPTPAAPPAAQLAAEATSELRQADTMAAQLARAYSAPVKPAAGSSRVAASKKAQTAATAGRGRAAKTLVPPPPPLSSAPAAEGGGQVQLSASSVRDAKATAGMQLKRSSSYKAATSEQPAAAVAATPHAAGTSPLDRRPVLRSLAHSSAEASPSRAAPLHAANGSHAPPQAAGDVGRPASPVATARLRSSGPPPGFGTGPPPGFARPLGGAAVPAAALAAYRVEGQPQAPHGGPPGGQSAQLPLPLVSAPQHAAGNGLMTAAAAEPRNGSARRESRFSFARSPPVSNGALLLMAFCPVPCAGGHR